MKKIDNDICKERLINFQKLASEIKLNYRKSLFHNKSLVLFENRMNSKNKYFGRDEFANSVIVRSEENLEGKIKQVRITGGNINTLFGEIDQSNQRVFAA